MTHVCAVKFDDTGWLKVKGWEKIRPANNQKAVEMAIFITHKMTLKQRKLSDIS